MSQHDIRRRSSRATRVLSLPCPQAPVRFRFAVSCVHPRTPGSAPYICCCPRCIKTRTLHIQGSSPNQPSVRICHMFDILSVALSLAAAVVATAPVCTDSYISVSASATNYDLSNGTFPAAATVPVSGTYTIQLRFCAPTVVVPTRVNTLQVLVHGLTYSTNYWDIAYKPDTYSYVRVAAANGYPTLNMARLGTSLTPSVRARFC